MCICWCVTEINYKMHGATIMINSGLFGFISRFKYDREIRTGKTAKKSQEGTKSSVITKMSRFRTTLFLNSWDFGNKLLTYVNVEP